MVITRGQLNRENEASLSLFTPEKFALARRVSRVSLLILHTHAESGACSPDSSRFPRRRPFIYTINPLRASLEFIRSRNDCISVYSIAYTPAASRRGWTRTVEVSKETVRSPGVL